MLGSLPRNNNKDHLPVRVKAALVRTKWRELADGCGLGSRCQHCCPCFNGGRFIDQLLDRCRAVTFRDFERSSSMTDRAATRAPLGTLTHRSRSSGMAPRRPQCRHRAGAGDHPRRFATTRSTRSIWQKPSG